MTPSNNQQGERKDLLPTEDDSPHGRTASAPRTDAGRSTRPLDTETKSESEIDEAAGGEDEDDEEDGETETVLVPAFPYGTIVYHSLSNRNDNDDPVPLCATDGSYRRLPLDHARAHADRPCQACVARQEGVDRRPCPRCDELIPVTRWPQHVGHCDGTSDAETESDNETDGDTETESEPVTETQDTDAQQTDTNVPSGRIS